MEYTNITIKAPLGTNVRGDGNLLCTPTQWNDVVIFLLGNCFSHAATIVSKPGEPYRDLFFRTFAALLFPLTGMHDGLKAITRHAVFQKNPLRRAARAGALCMLVRSSQWKPQEGDVIHGIKITDDEKATLQKSSPALRQNQALTPTVDSKKKAWHRLLANTSDSKPELDFLLESGLEPRRSTDSGLPELVYKSFYSKLRFGGEDLVKVPALYEVDGLIEKSEEYELMFVPDEAQVVPQPLQTETAYPATMSANYGLAKALVAVFQTIYSSVTPYRARADQLTNYGYAAFGLTVAPHAVMSIVNLIGNMLTPDYAALHLVKSEDLEEAVRRGNEMGATVGQLKIGSFDDTTWTGMFDHVDPASSTYTMTFYTVQPSGAVKAENRFQASIRIDANASDKGFLAETMLQPADRKSIMKHHWVRFVLGVLVALTPLIINGAISGFKPGKSSSAERGWTMSWLIMGITGCAGLVYLFTFVYFDDEDHLKLSGQIPSSLPSLLEGP